MNEAEWLACTDPRRILRWLIDTGKANDRKLRLFAVAYCRLQWHLLADVRSQEAVKVAERNADDLATPCERESAAAAALTAASEAAEAREGASELSPLALTAYAATAAWYTVFYEARSAAMTTCDADAADWYAENGIEMPHTNLLHELFGNPFHPIDLEPAWRKPTILSLAQSIYEERKFDRLTVLADALEEADCHDANILAHCRSEATHYRGCWALDLVLDKR
jgi:hypothetical protein